MSNAEFIALVAGVAVEDWKKRKIMLPSVVIAQAIHESGYGTSELATEAKALFGIKKNGWKGKTYVKDAKEQNKDGSYSTVKNTVWRAYDSWEDSVIDHNDYIATREKSKGVLRYAAIIGNTDYKAVCQLLKDCGYATSQKYTEKLLGYIDKHDLTQYDTITEERDNMAKIVIDAGHGLNTQGKRCLKSIDRNQTREWWLNDRIADKLQKELKAYGCEVLRVDDTTGRKDVSLADRIEKANSWGADFYISIHHNAGIEGGKGGGTQVYYYSTKEERKKQAKALYDAVVGETGLVGNRASKVCKAGFDVLEFTKMPALLLENGFMDSTADTLIILTEEHATKTAQGILKFLVDTLGLNKVKESTPEKDTSFLVKVIVDGLNIRKKPSVKNAIVGVIKDKGTYTIVDTEKSEDGCTWGLLKSYAKQRNGWINISSCYVTRKD